MVVQNDLPIDHQIGTTDFRFLFSTNSDKTMNIKGKGNESFRIEIRWGEKMIAQLCITENEININDIYTID